MSADTAPAAMPGGSIRAIIEEALCQVDPVEFAAANIEALFAPVLAEKERQLSKLAEDWDAHGVKMAGQILDEREARLAAEAALAAERERCALIAEKIEDAALDEAYANRYDVDVYEQGKAKGAKLVAAAIRSQGE